MSTLEFLSKKTKMSFSEEKNQKTFIFSATSFYPAMAGMQTLAQNQKSFGSFLQKRTRFT
jgi:hypothetical protein